MNKKRRIVLMCVIVFIALFSILVWEVTNSIFFVILGNTVLFIIYITKILIQIRIEGRGLREFVKKFCLYRELDRNEQKSTYKRGGVIINNVGYSSIVHVFEDGIYIYSYLVCTAIIPWEYIKKAVVQGDKVYLDLKVSAEEGISITLPWRQEFTFKLKEAGVI